MYRFGEQLRERGGLAWWFGSAIVLAGSVGWLAGRVLKAAVARQREHLADARAVQWTRSRDGLGATLRKVMTQQAQLRPAASHQPLGGHTGLDHPALQHMLLVEPPHRRAWQDHLDSHPPLAERVRRIYGRPMPPLPLQPLQHPPEPRPPAAASVPGAVPLAALHDPYA